MIHVDSLAAGDSGTAQTVRLMRDLVDRYQAHPRIRAAVLSAVRDSPGKEPIAELHALLEAVRARVRFTRDPVSVELVQSPARMLEVADREGMAFGDCDDIATLFATLAEAAGYPTRFLVQGPAGEPFSHVLVEVEVNGQWIAVDPSQSSYSIGWKPSTGIGREWRESMVGRYRVNRNGDMLPLPEIAPVPALGAGRLGLGQDQEESGFWDSLSEFTGSLAKAAGESLPLLERYGVVKPIVGYSSTGQPIYAAATLPAGGAAGAAYTAATQPMVGGLTLPQLLLLGGGILLVVLMVGGGRKR